MANIGYKRISTTDQSLDRQLDNIEIDFMFEEVGSSLNKDRPELNKMLNYIRPGDIVYIHSIDRLARSIADLIEIAATIRSKKASLKFITENLEISDSTNPVSELLFHIMAAFAQFEKKIIAQRQKEGIAQARLKGIYTGRKALGFESKQMIHFFALYLNYIPKKKACALAGISFPTAQKYIDALQFVEAEKQLSLKEKYLQYQFSDKEKELIKKYKLI